MRSKGKGADSTKQTPKLGKLLIGSFILWVFMALNLSALIGGGASWGFGLGAGLATGFGFISLAMAVNYMFEGKPYKLWLINASYMTVVFAVMGLIIGAMQ